MSGRFIQRGPKKVTGFNKENNVTKLILQPKLHSRSRYEIYKDQLVLIVHSNGDLMLTDKVLKELGHPNYVGVGVSADCNSFGVCAMDDVAGRSGYGWAVPKLGPNANVSRVGCGRILLDANIARESGPHSWKAYEDMQDDTKYIMANTAQNPSLV